MEQTEKQTIQPIPSRTLRVNSNGFDITKYNFKNVLNGNVYFITFDVIEDAIAAYTQLKNDKISVRYHVYSLFTKFDKVLTKEVLDEKVKEILGTSNYNLTYSRVDNKNKNNTCHTGKVVLDKIEDCKTLLIYKDTTDNHLRFYRFDPKKTIKRS